MESSAERASNNHALNGPRGVLELVRNEERQTRVARLEGVFVEENSAVVLGDHIEIVLQRLVAAKTHTFLQTICHGPLRWLASKLGSKPEGFWDSRKEAVACQMAFLFF